MLILIIAVIWLWHIGIYHASTSLLTLNDSQLIAFTWILCMASLSFVIMSIIVNLVYTKIWSRLYTASAVWMGTRYWLCIASAITLVLISINTRLGWNIPVMIVGRFLMLLALCISAYGIWNGNQTKIVHYTVPMRNLPDQREGRKIAMIADTHVWVVRNVWLLHRIRPQIEAEWVEMLLVAGDYWDGPKANDVELAQALAEIKTPHGTYFAPGNHESYGGTNRYLKTLEQAWIHTLNDKVVDIDGLQIIGVDYSYTITQDVFATTLDTLTRDRSQPSILIKHIPSHVDVVNEFGIDLQVAWHVHQWQVRPWSIPARWVYGPFAYGLNQIGRSWIITTSGVGTRWPPQRVGTQSEIVIITLVKK